MSKLKVLVFSRTPWRTDNSFGNTYSNWFAKMEDVDVAHICLADGLPFKEKNISRYYQVSERRLAKSIFYRQKVGECVDAIVPSVVRQEKDSSFFGRIVSYCKTHRLSLFFILRELIWKWGKVDYAGMRAFIKDFDPDVAFMPMYYAGYVDRVALNVLKGMHVPVVLEAAIDVYTLKQISFDPFYWINRFYIRKETREITKVAKLLYVISEKQQRDYVKFFKLPIKVMYKFPDYNRMKFAYKVSGQPVKYLFTGNVGLGRWKSLNCLAKALQTIGGGTLDIYTATALTDRQKAALNIEGVCTLHPPISQQLVIEEQNKADVLVHVESFNIRNKLAVRYSISTKIMDYISVGRCILAIGPYNVASLEYLRDHNLALIANEKEVVAQVQRINSNHSIIENIAKANVSFLQNSLNEENLRNRFKMDLENIAKAYKN